MAQDMDLLARMKLRLGYDVAEYSDELLEDVLDSAGAAILGRRYPFGIPSGVVRVPVQYEDLQLRCAIDIVNRMGVEGETQHTENGVTRIYEKGSGHITESLLREVIPVAGVVFR